MQAWSYTQISDEEEQLQRARLGVRRGMPLKDVNELKTRQNRVNQQQQGRPGQDRCLPFVLCYTFYYAAAW